MFWVESILPSRPWQAARRVRLLFHFTLSVFNNILLRLTVIGPLLVWQGVVNSKGWGLCPLLGLKGCVPFSVKDEEPSRGICLPSVFSWARAITGVKGFNLGLAKGVAVDAGIVHRAG